LGVLGHLLELLSREHSGWGGNLARIIFWIPGKSCGSYFLTILEPVSVGIERANRQQCDLSSSIVFIVQAV
jgi:hypothetical protein